MPRRRPHSTRAEDPERSQRHRAVMNDARRTIERSLMVAGAAEELAKSVEELLTTEERGGPGLAKVREALARYRAAHGDA